MKIVINSCYGGFTLSSEAEELYAKKSGFEIFRYEQTMSKHSDGEDLFEKTDGAENSFISYTFKKDLGKTFVNFDNDSYWYSRDIERNDNALIEVVEELGEASSGSYSKLIIVEIPDDISWGISEYDGYESVEEAHRSWS